MRYDERIYNPHTGGRRPIHMTSEFYLEILSKYEEGYTLRELAKIHGVSAPTVRNWVQKGMSLKEAEEIDGKE